MSTAPSGTQWTISYADQTAVVVEVGGGLRTYQAKGREVVDGYAEDEMCPAAAGQILAPWPNRLRDGQYTFGGHTYQLPLSEPGTHNAVHGLVRWAPWRLLEQTPSAVTVGLDLPAQPAYPWSLSLTTRWELADDGLTVTHTATNTAAEPAPFGLGAHPYLLPPVSLEDAWLCIPARTRLLLGARALPIGAAKVAGSEFDYTVPKQIGTGTVSTAFGDVILAGQDRHAVTLGTADGPVTSVWADAAFAWWQFYTADSLPEPRRRRAIAVEPMTCPPDALRSGHDLIVLKPGEPWSASWGITPH
ncbi:aldose 1-epimerase [Micromonospora pallida]|uniref:Aldose 1-epimerase n=1 Tax=Micromonospora pallida TaxID=145854 RepID=A0A1C6TD20_9ACTN|nr:aldose 1-epimerase family protein [Micromonospora pallida]SCL39355.1 aldose 1-epimerase [Micromonospora pallida]